MPSADVFRREILSPHARHMHTHQVRAGHAHHAHELRSAAGPQEAVAATILVARDGGKDDGSDHLINLLLIILGIAFLALLLVSALFLIRRARQQRLRREQELQPQQGEKGGVLPPYGDAAAAGRGGLTIETKHNGRSSVFYIGRDGQPMLQNPNSPPHSPDNVPEIRITFPDEQDENGRPRSGRVVVVRVGDNASVGLEPVSEEQLPAYEKEAMGQFHSIDMDRIGGLKEKDAVIFQ